MFLMFVCFFDRLSGFCNENIPFNKTLGKIQCGTAQTLFIVKTPRQCLLSSLNVNISIKNASRPVFSKAP